MRKKPNALENRILQQLLDARHGNPTATVVYRPVGPKQEMACSFLSRRGFLRMSGPAGQGRRKTYEYSLTPQGVRHLNRLAERTAA